MRRRWAAMTEDNYSTLWELWTKEASLNHGWSGGPLIILSKYVAGIRAEGDGSRYTVAPELCGLRQVDCTAPTRFGPLRVRIDRDAKRMEVTYPKALSVTILPPSGEEREAWTVISGNL